MSSAVYLEGRVEETGLKFEKIFSIIEINYAIRAP
jgi:hypothetical protein